jgi:cyclophilin family peptidyl-prolyl cis-trans isomerase
MINRKRPGLNRSQKQTCKFNEPLERRIMMAAQAVGTVPSQSLTVGGTPSAIALSSYLDDSVIPAGDTVVEVQTSLPSPNDVFPMILTNAATPNTVANFLSYISNGEYTDQIIHRSIPAFIIQGGAFNTSGASLATSAPIDGESSTAVLKNSMVGTIAMALQSGSDSADTGTDSWFFNLADNSSLDTAAMNQGPFTAFGEVIYNGDTAINALAAVPVFNASSTTPAWDNLPLQNFSGGSFDTTNFVSVSMAVDNNPLIYSATSSNAAKVTAAISNGTLQLTAVAAGTATITVTATDLAGGTATQTIPVTVAAAGAPVVSIGSASGTIGTNSQISFPVTLSSAASAAVTMAYTTVAGTAAAGDFSTTTGTLTIPAGQTTATISVPVTKDSSGAAETFQVRLSNISANATFNGGGISLFATGTIQPAVVIPTVTVGSGSATIGTDSEVTFPVTLSTAASTAVTVDYTTVAGTAVAGDFTVTSGTLTIPAGSVSVDVSVGVEADSTGTAESFTLELSSLSSNAVFTGSAATISATGTIEPAAVSTATATVSSLIVPLQELVLGGSTTLASSVTTAAGTPVTTGSVNFIENGTTVATVALDANGDAAYTQTFTTTGNLAITAQYADVTGTFAASTSTPSTLAVTTLTPVTGKSTVPATIVAGNAASGSTVVTVTNSETTLAKGTITVNVYASTTGILDSTAILVGTAKKGVKLATGKAVAVGVAVKIKTTTLAAGTYTLLSQTVDLAGNLSTAVVGPTLTVAPAVVTFTATMTKLTTPATAVVAGAKTKAAAVVKIANSGNVASTSPLMISLYASTDGTVADGTLIRTLPVKVAIKPGKSATITVPLSAYPAVANGTYSIVAAISDGAGNPATAVSGSTVAIDAAFVDLAAEKTTGPKTAVIGKNATVTVSFVNNGNFNATGLVPMAVGLSANADGSDAFSLGTVFVKTNLPAGKTQTAKFAVPVVTGLATGTYYIVTTVDSTNVLNEPNVTDNTVVSLVTVTLT